jgi:hypothetical protein
MEMNLIKINEEYSDENMNNYLTEDEIKTKFYNLTNLEKRIVYYAIVINSVQFQEEIAKKMGIARNTVSYHLRKPNIAEIVNAIKHSQIMMTRDAIVNSIADLTLFSLDELKQFIVNSEGKLKLDGIKAALEYDTKNKLNMGINENALNSSLIYKEDNTD